MKKNISILIFLLSFVFISNAQDLEYAKEVVTKLSSPKFHGRGYVKKGDLKAAKYIKSEYKKLNLESFNGGYFQDFNFPVNSFPKAIEVRVDGKELNVGKEVMMNASSPSISGTFDLIWLNEESSLNELLFEYRDTDLSNSIIITNKKDYILEDKNVFKAAAVIYRSSKKLYWRYADGTRLADFPYLKITEEALPKGAGQIQLDIQNKFIESHQTQNVIGYIKGKTNPDKYIVFTGHYDHLGRMGKNVYFPGANDNASGIAMLLDLAKHFSKPENQPDYSIVFMSFAAEESGLLGSRYFTENPIFPLKSINALINLDMVGTGSDGITVVNGVEVENLYNSLVQINKENEYLKVVKARKAAANSDHYYFYKNNVPAVFIYTMGNEYSEYHTITDLAKDVPFTEYEDLFKLLRDYIITNN